MYICWLQDWMQVGFCVFLIVIKYWKLDFFQWAYHWGTGIQSFSANKPRPRTVRRHRCCDRTFQQWWSHMFHAKKMCVFETLWRLGYKGCLLHKCIFGWHVYFAGMRCLWVHTNVKPGQHLLLDLSCFACSIEDLLVMSSDQL